MLIHAFYLSYTSQFNNQSLIMSHTWLNVIHHWKFSQQTACREGLWDELWLAGLIDCFVESLYKNIQNLWGLCQGITLNTSLKTQSEKK